MIVLGVQHLDDLTHAAKCLTKEGKKVPDCREQNIALFLGGRRINQNLNSFEGGSL